MEDVGVTDAIIKVLSKSVLSAILKDKSCMQRFGFTLEEHTFDNPIHKLVFKIGRGYFEQYGRLPTVEGFRGELTQRLDRGEGGHVPNEFFWREVDEIYSLDIDREYISDKVDEWRTRKALLDIATQARVAALSPEPTLDLVRRRLHEIEMASLGGRNLGEYIFKDLERRDRTIQEGNFIPTGIAELDIVLGGGRKKGTLGVIMAATGAGKSSILITLGVNASRMRYKVAHISLELGHHAVVHRYEAAYSRIAKPQIRAQEEEVKRRMGRIKRLIRPADVIVKEYPSRGFGVGDLRAWLANLEFWDEFVPDLLIVDYADIMKLPGKSEDRWIQQGDLYTELRGLAQEKDVGLWTGLQAKKGTLTKKKLNIDDLAGAIEKAQIADAIIAVCRTDAEIAVHQGRFFIAKNRDNIDNVVVKFREDFSKSIVVSISKALYVEREPGDDQEETPLPQPTQGEQGEVSYEDDVPF